MSDTPPPPPAPGQGDPQAPTPPAPPSQPYAAPTAPVYGAPAPGHPAPGYGAPATGYAPAAAPRTNPLAIAALITACGGVIVWVLAPIAGAIMGHIALGQIKRTGENGRGLALAGVLVGWILGGLQLIGIVAYIIFVVAIVAAGAGSGYDY